MADLEKQALDNAIATLQRRDEAKTDAWTELAHFLKVSEDDLVYAINKWHGISVVPEGGWAEVKPIAEETKFISENIFLVNFRSKNYLLSTNPWSRQALVAMSQWARYRPQFALARPGQISALKTLLITPTSATIRRTSQSENDTNGGEKVVQFVDQAILQAYKDGASDIHFETSRQGIQVKFRIDGVMVGGPSFPEVTRSEEVISRIKVLAQLDITERRRPQDGRIHWSDASDLTQIDLRVSIMPSILGEDAVLRLLDKAQLRESQNGMTLEALGFTTSSSNRLRELTNRPHGMLLITGPTGSGKTTTIYASLSEVNSGLEKIITIEDPVEYELPGVLQIPVNEQKGLTFATGLRSILRHDPDKILVGEIRDSETAEIAIQSALTGHLVFTTVHANSLFDVLGRFQHFGIDPFALASALNGVVVQRLLRRLCPECVSWRKVSPEESRKLTSNGFPNLTDLPHAQGCPHCRNTGYRGRFAVAEIHELDDRLRDLIIRRSSIADLKQVLYSNETGTRLLHQALSCVHDGVTTLEEVIRVVGFS